MFLSRSRSLKIKKKLFDKMKHASWTSYNNLVSRSGPYWSFNFTDCAMENTPYFSNTSAKMNFASSDCSAMTSMSNSLSWLYFLRYRSKKMISKEESENHFDLHSLFPAGCFRYFPSISTTLNGIVQH